MKEKDLQYSRRDFLMAAAAAGIASSIPGLVAAATSGPASSQSASASAPASRPLKNLRVGFVGVGGRGTGHVRNLLKLPGVQIVALCDIIEEKVAAAQDIVVKAGQAKPTGYSKGNTDFKRLCETEDLDIVYNATPWEWHVPICLSAMENGKHAVVEVPAAVTLDECWQLVETVEKTKLHCIMAENCCYDRDELMFLNMVRKGLFGELTNAECGYLHDLRNGKFNMKKEGVWRRAHSIARNGDLYPTHGLGPIAQYMNINRGNQFARLVSMASKSRGLHLFAVEKFGVEDPRAKEVYKLGDMVTTLIETELGETITVKHNTDSPHPYSRDILIQGTKGLARKYPEGKIHIEGKSAGKDGWDDLENWREKFEHPLWRELALKAQGAGHGGMDYIVNYRIMRCFQLDEPQDMDVYDAAAWSAVSALSEKSIASKSQPQEFPDFTRGKWKQREPLGIVTA